MSTLDNNLRAKVKVTDTGITVLTSINTLEPARFDFPIVQGQDLALRLNWSDERIETVDISAYTARLKIKQYYDSTDPLESLTHADGITLAAAAPNITISRTAAQTAAYSWVRALYDLELIDGSGVVIRLLEGFVSLRKNVTA